MAKMLKSFLKWAGGKRWLIQNHEEIFPKTYQRYIEPFLGGGSVFFHLHPHVSILSDSNAALINAYSCIKTSPHAIDMRLKLLHRSHCVRQYYKIRDSTPPTNVEEAIRFIYLNRTCYNGLYRVNRAGEFNVPIGTKLEVKYPNGYLDKISKILSLAELLTSDFEAVVDMARTEDFLFIDPPYTVMHNNNNFIKYNASLFSWKDQVRLAAAIRRADARGALIMLSNADHSSIRELYANFGTHRHLNRSSVLSGTVSHRRMTTELIITNY